MASKKRRRFIWLPKIADTPYPTGYGVFYMDCHVASLLAMTALGEPCIYSLISRMVRLMRLRFSSTSSTATLTTSPTDTTSEGCLMNLLQT